MTENLERHQEKLEEKQAACLEQIREMEKQVTGVGGTTTLAHSRAGLAPGCKGTQLRGAASQEVGGCGGLAPLQGVRALIPRGS